MPTPNRTEASHFCQGSAFFTSSGCVLVSLVVAATCEKYGWVSIFSNQDMLLRPSQLEWTDDGRVVFIHENQEVWSLATSAAGDDPPVWIDADNVGIGQCHTWPKANESLSRFLTTFCLQELTFGSRMGVWDAELTRMFRSGQPSITPLWLNRTYVWPDCQYDFCQMDDDVLVGTFGSKNVFEKGG